MGSGCGSVGRAVASDIRGSNPVIGTNLIILNICLLSTVNCKDENKGKEAGNGPLKKTFWQTQNLTQMRQGGESRNLTTSR